MVLKLSALFSLDAFAGGFIPQSLMAYWFHLQFGVEPGGPRRHLLRREPARGGVVALGGADRGRIGLINTMVFTHLPSNVLLLLVPLMPNLPLAIAVLLLRFSLSQMDVPTRQSYVIAVVDPDERSAAAGVTGIARTTGAAISPSISSVLIANSTLICGAVLPRRRPQDPVRPAALPRLPIERTAGCAAVAGGGAASGVGAAGSRATSRERPAAAG